MYLPFRYVGGGKEAHEGARECAHVSLISSNVMGHVAKCSFAEVNARQIRNAQKVFQNIILEHHLDGFAEQSQKKMHSGPGTCHRQCPLATGDACGANHLIQTALEDGAAAQSPHPTTDRSSVGSRTGRRLRTLGGVQLETWLENWLL